MNLWDGTELKELCIIKIFCASFTFRDTYEEIFLKHAFKEIVKMKKILSIYLCILMCVCCLSSCDASRMECAPPDGANMNYNNIGFGRDYWLDNDSYCYLSTSLSRVYYIIDEHSKTRIGSNGGYGGGSIQKYGNKIYMLHCVDNVDDYNSTYELKLYDVNFAETTMLTSINNCETFLVLDETVYYLEYSWVNDSKISTLKKYSVDSKKHETIKEKIISFGIKENSVFYLAEENNEISIYKYNAESESSIKQGEFYLDEDYILELQELEAVSYTPDYLLFKIPNYENVTSSKIFKYSFKNNDLISIDFDEFIDNFISYNSYSYFTTYNKNSDISKLYKMDNNTNEIVQLQTIKGLCASLFVCSDNGTYVYEFEDCDLNYYSNEPNASPITVVND